VDPDEIRAEFLATKGAGGGVPTAGPPGAAQDNPKVYMGQGPGDYPNRGRRDWDVTPKGKVKHTPKELTIQGAVNRIYEDDKFLEKVKKRLIAAGRLDPEKAGDMLAVEDAWGKVLAISANYYAKGRKRTPWDVLELEKRNTPGAEKVPQGYSAVTGQMLPGWTTGADGNPVHAPYGLDPETGKPKGRFQSSSSSSSSVNDLTDGDAWAIMRNAATNALGRKASHEEIREFAYRANQIAAENPDEVTTDQTVDAATGSSASHTTRKSGFNQNDAERMAEEELENTPEAGAYQAATTYYNAMLGALDSPVNM